MAILVTVIPILFIYWVNNIIPYQPIKILQGKIKDPTLDATAKYMLGLILFLHGGYWFPYTLDCWCIRCTYWHMRY